MQIQILVSLTFRWSHLCRIIHSWISHKFRLDVEQIIKNL